MFEQIPEFIKTALYESADCIHELDENGDEYLRIVYNKDDVMRIASLFGMDFDVLNTYWCDFLGVAL